ncbi:MAG: excinuclease ABC subunit UvrC [Deltaproteobacteria bacterium]|nr:excinuclease ABC subunit UvrC [Deltaproteobacteria bacterium]
MELKAKIEEFPNSPGVYLMKDAQGKVIYVGKAVNLKARVKSYFSKEALLRYQIQFLMKRVEAIDTLLCGTEKEALLLENSLIKKHRPRYNVSLKDDKTYVSLKLSLNHPFPALTVTRKIKKDGAAYFGPYSSAAAVRSTVDFIYRNFQLRTCSDSEIKNRARPCLEYQIHRCQAPCVGYIGQKDYAGLIARVKLFLEGKDLELIREVGKKMQKASEAEHFEEAAKLRDLLNNIQETLEKQRVVRHTGRHRDVVFLHRPGKKGIAAFLHYREGVLVDSRYFLVDGLEEDSELMEKIVSGHYLGPAFIPDEIIVSVPFEGVKALEELLGERKGKKVSILATQKGEKKEALELAARNASAQYDRLIKKEFQVAETLEALQAALGLPQAPHRIECYDVSNPSGKKATASRVVFIDGTPNKNEYRHYRIRMEEEPNDYAMMKEVLGRRFKGNKKDIEKSPLPPFFKGGKFQRGVSREELSTPPFEKGGWGGILVVIDGGKGQLNAALEVLKEAGLEAIPVIGIAKGHGPGARAKGLWKEKKEEEIWLPGRKNPLILRRGSPELMLLQRVRDEAHRLAIKYHRKLRDVLSS